MGLYKSLFYSVLKIIESDLIAGHKATFLSSLQQETISFKAGIARGMPKATEQFARNFLRPELGCSFLKSD